MTEPHLVRKDTDCGLTFDTEALHHASAKPARSALSKYRRTLPHSSSSGQAANRHHQLAASQVDVGYRLRPVQLTQVPVPLHLLASIVPSHRAPCQRGERSLIAAAKRLVPWLFVGLKPTYRYLPQSRRREQEVGRTRAGNASLGAILQSGACEQNEVAAENITHIVECGYPRYCATGPETCS